VFHRTPFILLVIAVILALTGGASFAQTGETKQIGVVVTFPDGTTHTEVVTVPTSATALDALKAAKLSVETADGSFGPALCKINATGCPVDNCFCDEKTYWAYFHLNGTAWANAQEGVGAYVPADKAVEGFAWSGFDANFNPTVLPPVHQFDQLLAKQAPGLPVALIVALVLLIVAVVALVWYMQRMLRQSAR